MRMFQIILGDIATEKLALEEELERVLNNDIEVNEKKRKIRYILNQMALLDISGQIWSSYIPKIDKVPDNDNNE